MATVLKFGVELFSDSPGFSDPVPLVGEILSLLLPYHTYLVSTRGNHKKVFASTCQRLLLPALQLKYLISRKSMESGLKAVLHDGFDTKWNAESVIEGLDGLVLSLFSRCLTIGGFIFFWCTPNYIFLQYTMQAYVTFFFFF